MSDDDQHVDKKPRLSSTDEDAELAHLLAELNRFLAIGDMENANETFALWRDRMVAARNRLREQVTPVQREVTPPVQPIQSLRCEVDDMKMALSQWLQKSDGWNHRKRRHARTRNLDVAMDVRFDIVSLDAILHDVPDLTADDIAALRTITDAFWAMVDNDPDLKQMYDEVMAGTASNEAPGTSSLMAAFVHHLFTSFFCKSTASLPDDVLLFTRSNLEFWPSLKGSMPAEPTTIARMDEAAIRARFAGASMLTPELLHELEAAVDNAPSPASHCPPIANDFRLARWLSSEATDDAEQEADVTPIANCLDWLTSRDAEKQFDGDVPHPVDWTCFRHENAGQVDRLFCACSRTRTFLAGEVKRSGEEKTPLMSLTRRKLMHSFAVTMGDGPVEGMPVMFGIATDFRSFRLARISFKRETYHDLQTPQFQLVQKSDDGSRVWRCVGSDVEDDALLLPKIFARIVRGASHLHEPTDFKFSYAVPILHSSEADAADNEPQLKLRGVVDYEWTNHEIRLERVLSWSCRTGVCVVRVFARGAAAGAPSDGPFVMKIVGYHRLTKSTSFLNEVVQLRNERGKPGVVQLAGWFDDGESKFMLLSTVGESLLRLCLCSAERRAAVRKVIVRDVGGALVRWHAEGKAHGDLFPRNIIVDESLSRAWITDLESLGVRSSDDGEPTRGDSMVSIRVGGSKLDVECLVNLILGI